MRATVATGQSTLAYRLAATPCTSKLIITRRHPFITGLNQSMCSPHQSIIRLTNRMPCQLVRMGQFGMIIVTDQTAGNTGVMVMAIGTVLGTDIGINEVTKIIGAVIGATNNPARFDPRLIRASRVDSRGRDTPRQHLAFGSALIDAKKRTYLFTTSKGIALAKRDQFSGVGRFEQEI